MARFSPRALARSAVRRGVVRNERGWRVIGWVILVGFDNPATDLAAKAQLESWFPNRDVYVIEMLDSWIEGGGVHCHTNDQPAASTIGTLSSSVEMPSTTCSTAVCNRAFAARDALAGRSARRACSQ